MKAIPIPNGLAPGSAPTAMRLGEKVVTKGDLPPAGTTRWVANKKLQVLGAIRSGMLSRAEARERYALADSELERWIASEEKGGVEGLKCTKPPHSRRGSPRHVPRENFSVGRFEIEPAARRVAFDGKSMLLTRYEMTLFALLAESADTVVSREEMLDALYGSRAAEPERKILDVFVCRLRRKLRDLGCQPIESSWGRGYLLRSGT